jgi:hypothetical protein
MSTAWPSAASPSSCTATSSASRAARLLAGRRVLGTRHRDRPRPRVTRYALDGFGICRVYALPFAHNVASCRVLEKAGYLCEGRLRRSVIKNGEVLDQLLYAFVDEERASSLASAPHVRDHTQGG